MHHFVADPEHQLSSLDVATINVDRLGALASLLTVENVASAFADLTIGEQVAIFGTFESGLEQARAALTQIAEKRG